MIALALGLVLTLGVTQIFLGGSESYRQNQGFSHAQESARFISALLQPELRAAGSLGCVSMMGRPVTSTIENRLNTSLPVAIGQAIQGWDYNNTEPGDSYTLPATLSSATDAELVSGDGTLLPGDISGNAIDGSDVVVINTLDSINVSIGTPPQNGSDINLADSSGVSSGNVVLASTEDCSE
ncbi:hypothetical protein CF392_16115, partial [Tamilnaduibacter salinus]